MKAAIIVFLALTTIFFAATVIRAVNNHNACQRNIAAAAVAVGSSAAIDSVAKAQQSAPCVANQTFAKLVSSLFK